MSLCPISPLTSPPHPPGRASGTSPSLRGARSLCACRRLLHCGIELEPGVGLRGWAGEDGAVRNVGPGAWPCLGHSSSTLQRCPCPGFCGPWAIEVTAVPCPQLPTAASCPAIRRNPALPGSPMTGADPAPGAQGIFVCDPDGSLGTGTPWPPCWTYWASASPQRLPLCSGFLLGAWVWTPRGPGPWKDFCLP